MLSIYKKTKIFPEDEKFGLVSQLRRSAGSIPSNIVEGFKRNSRKEYLHFLNIAETSLEETKYHLILSKDLNYLEENAYNLL
ncbi:MAG: four helix bundle protein, partial [Elusimicrobia bacterium]|nr:four helix bundle protein [Elusimicrobiota bacterium]